MGGGREFATRGQTDYGAKMRGSIVYYLHTSDDRDMLTRRDVEAIDVSGLHRDYEEWPRHCEEALRLRVATPEVKEVKRVVYVGMGGSAASGDILRDWLTPVLKVPFIVSKDYGPPRFVGAGDLVLAVSCSGDTEETLNVVKEVFKRGCGVAAVSSDGLLEKFCGENDLAFTKVKKLAVPRSSLPYLFYPAVNILSKTGHLKEEAGQLKTSVGGVKSLHREIGVDTHMDKNEAKKLASKIFNGVPVLYASAVNLGVAVRFAASLNENAKMLAHTAVIPELCHNEVESWVKGIPGVFKPVFIRSSEEPRRISERFKVARELIEAAGLNVYEFWETGEDRLSRSMRSVYLLDYVTIYAAVLRRVNPIVTPNIEALKKRLSAS